MFGYGSLIWRPDFPYLEHQIASINGFARRFWQNSHDHRGTPDAPGRVVTLVYEPDSVCLGMAYRLDDEIVQSTFEQLDYREKNGYERHEVTLQFKDQSQKPGLVYIAAEDNFAYAGESRPDDIAGIIAKSHGPSGANREYLFKLAIALRELNIDDPHVFDLEQRVKNLPIRN